MNAIIESENANSQSAALALKSQILREKARKLCAISDDLTKGKIFFSDCSNGTSCVFIGQFLTPQKIGTENALSIGIGGFYQEFYHSSPTKQESTSKRYKKGSNNLTKNPHLQKIFQFSYTPRIKAACSREEHFHLGEKISCKTLYADGTLLQFFYNSKSFNWIKTLAQKRQGNQHRFVDFTNSNHYPGSSSNFNKNPSLSNNPFTKFDIKIDTIVQGEKWNHVTSLPGSERMNFTVFSQLFSTYLSTESDQLQVSKMLVSISYPFGKHLISFAGPVQGRQHSFKMRGKIFFNKNLCVGNAKIEFRQPNVKYSLWKADSGKRFSTVEAFISHLEIQKIKSLTETPSIEKINGFQVFKIGKAKLAQGFFLNDHLIVPKQDLVSICQKWDVNWSGNGSQAKSGLDWSMKSHLEKEMESDNLETPKNRGNKAKQFNFESRFSPIMSENQSKANSGKIICVNESKGDTLSRSRSSRRLEEPTKADSLNQTIKGSGFADSSACLFCRKRENSKLNFKKSLKSLMELLKKYACKRCFISRMGISLSDFPKKEASPPNAQGWPKSFKELDETDPPENTTLEKWSGLSERNFTTRNNMTLKHKLSLGLTGWDIKFPLKGSSEMVTSKTGYSLANYEEDFGSRDLCLEKNPNYFRGEMKNYCKEGLVYENFEDEECFWGMYEGGYRSGFGRQFKYGKYVYEGDFKAGNKHGEGVIRFVSGEGFQAIFIRNRIRKVVKQMGGKVAMMKRDTGGSRSKSKFKGTAKTGRVRSKSPSWIKKRTERPPNFQKGGTRERNLDKGSGVVRRRSRFSIPKNEGEKKRANHDQRLLTDYQKPQSGDRDRDSGNSDPTPPAEINIFQTQITDWEKKSDGLMTKYGLGVNPSAKSKNVLQWIHNAERSLDHEELQRRNSNLNADKGNQDSVEASLAPEELSPPRTTAARFKDARSGEVRTKSRDKCNRFENSPSSDLGEITTVKNETAFSFDLPMLRPMEWNRMENTFHKSFKDRDRIQVDPRGGTGGKLFLRNIASFKEEDDVISFSKNLFGVNRKSDLMEGVESMGNMLTRS